MTAMYPASPVPTPPLTSPGMISPPKPASAVAAAFAELTQSFMAVGHVSIGVCRGTIEVGYVSIGVCRGPIEGKQALYIQMAMHVSMDIDFFAFIPGGGQPPGVPAAVRGEAGSRSGGRGGGAGAVRARQGGCSGGLVTLLRSMHRATRCSLAKPSPTWQNCLHHICKALGTGSARVSRHLTADHGQC